MFEYLRTLMRHSCETKKRKEFHGNILINVELNVI